MVNWTLRERQALAPPPDLTVSEWADKNRVLLPKTSREPGPWHTSRTPYLRAIMDSYNDPDVRHIVLQFGTQLGKSEGMILNILGYIISEDPYSTMLVYPSADDARSISRGRIQPMVDSSPCLREEKPFSDDAFQLSEMHFPGMILYVVGSNSPTPLSQKPCRNVLRDEINKYPLTVASGRDADPLSLSEERAKAFWDIRKIIDVSSPTVEEGNISRQLKTCHCVYFYHVPCPFCLKLQRLDFRQVKFENDRDLDRTERVQLAKESATYECQHCHKEIDDSYREWMLSEANGAKWISDTEPTRPPEKIGFVLSSLYSPWLRWGDITEKFLEAHLSGDHNKLMNFKNAWLAETWIDRVKPKEEADILSHRSDLPPLIVPKGAIALTAGIDTGQGGFWYVVRAWARDLTSWLVDYGFLMTWEDVHTLIFENVYQVEGQVEGFFRIIRAGVDIGGTVGEDGVTATEEAYQWLRAHGQRTAFGVKGMSRPMGKRLKLSVIDTMPGRTRRPIRGGLVLWHIDTAQFKDILHWRLQVKPGDPQAFYLNSETGSDYVKHILAEEKRRNKQGWFEWVQVATANHLLDCEVYASAMADSECWGGIQVFPKPRMAEGQKKVELQKQRNWILRGSNTNTRKKWLDR